MAYRKVILNQNKNRGVVYMYDTYYDFLDFNVDQFNEIDKNPTSNAFRFKRNYFSDANLTNEVQQGDSWFRYY